MSTESIMGRLRELWRAGDWKEFNRLYSLGKWWISKEDQQKIEIAMEMQKVRHMPEKEQELIRMTLEAMPGSKIVR